MTTASANSASAPKAAPTTAGITENVAADFAAKLGEYLLAKSGGADKLKSNVPEKAIGADGKLKWEHLDTGIERGGSKITLPDDPAPMPIEEAIKALKRKQKDEDTVVDVHEVIDAFPTDGAVAFVKAIRIKYGWANSVPTPSFFGPKPPAFITVNTGPDPEDKIQIPWGGFQIPGIENPVHTSTTNTRSGRAFVIFGKVHKKEVWILKELADLARAIVKAESIYRGKAIRLRADNDVLDVDNPPEFVATAGIRDDEIIMPQEVHDLIATNIWTPIEKTADCLRRKIPLKRGILLEGKYGTGKSLTALATAKKCVENGWTYITIDRVQGLRNALEFAKRYEPCVIFAEDIDRAAEDRDEHTNDLLNVLDGVLSKNSQIMVVLTTNHVEKVNQAMLRPGRLDAVISVLPPDADCVERLLRLYGRGLISTKVSLDKISQELSGQIPATIREVVERSKLSAIRNNRQNVSEDDLLTASASMRHHLALLNRSNSRILSNEERVGAAVADLLEDRIGRVLAKTAALLIATNSESDENVKSYAEDQLNSLRDNIVDLVLPRPTVTEIAKVDTEAK